MALTRRQFLKCTGAAAAGGLLGPGLFGNVFVQRALASTIGDRYLVVLFLDGGNDGLNTVAPTYFPPANPGFLRTAYQAARNTGVGGLRLSPDDLANTLIANDPNTNEPLAFHPGFYNPDTSSPAYQGLKKLYDLGKVAVIQGCGYPQYSLSHEQSRGIWQTANPLGVSAYSGAGWLGRYLKANYGPTNIPGVTLGDSVAPELRQTVTGVLAIQRLREFGFPYDDASDTDIPFKRDAFAHLYAAAGTGAGAQPSQIYLGDTGTATLTGSESYPPLNSLYLTDRKSFSDNYDALDTSTARALREIAKIIYGVKTNQPNVTARFFELRNGGYDTHSDQGAAATDGQHYALHSEVSNAIKVFYDDCAAMGVASKLCILVWSEFSRRIHQNDNGTDHGSQGPMFVIGGTVRGGVYGRHPNIDQAALDDDGNTVYTQSANGFRSTDIRDVYGTVLKHWLNMDPMVIKSSVLPLDPAPLDPAYYWRTENFDLKRPSDNLDLFA